MSGTAQLRPLTPLGGLGWSGIHPAAWGCRRPPHRHRCPRHRVLSVRCAPPFLRVCGPPASAN